MNYRRLGRTGLKVSEISLGTMTFGRDSSESEANRIVDLAFEAGINSFDTANSYADSASETILGKALQGRRRDAVVATKFFNPAGTDVNSSGLSRFHLMHAVEDSLRRLQMDHIDVYYIHHVDTQTPLDETLRALDDLVRQGKVRYTACSNFEAWRLMEAMWLSDHNGWERFAAYQPQYSLVVRDIEQEIVPVCQLKGIGVVVWSPLGGGFLAGKYRPGQRTAPGTRSEEGWAYPDRNFADNADGTLAALLEVAAELGRSPAQVAIRWTLDQPAITSAIVGARTPEQLRDNLGAGGWTLPSDALQRLNEVSRLPDRYPKSIEADMHERRDSAVSMPYLES